MGRRQAERPKVKFGTTLPGELLEQARSAAGREDMQMDAVFASALSMWLEAMEGRVEVYKPTHREDHRRLELILNAKNPAVLEALRGVLSLAEQILVDGRQSSSK